ncbi:MAG: response regulator, partial [Candidatus Zixiibacteriota bacterium]
LLGLPSFVNLFVQSVSYWLIAVSQLLIALGIVLTLWGVGNIASSMHQSEVQKSDDEEWRSLYLNIQDLSQQPFSFVEILNLSINQILKRAEADGAAVVLFKENTGELILAAFSNISPEITKRLERLGVGGDIFGRVQKLGRVQNVVNLSDADQATSALFEGSEFLSVSVFPLRGRDRILGSVALLSTKPFHFNQRRGVAINVASNQLAALLESVRNEKEILRLKDRLKPSEEAKRITEELFFRRGIGGNLELREAVEFERVRKFFDADCIKLVFRDQDGEFRIKASSGGAETGLLLDRRKLGGINRSVGERKLLLLTSPESTPAGKGFDSVPRQTLFIPIPYPDRDDLVLLLESENASLEFSEEKLSAVRVASVYLADLHFLFLAKRDGDSYRNSIQQLDSCLKKLLESSTVDQIVDALSESSGKLLPNQKARFISFDPPGYAGITPRIEGSGIKFPSDLARAKQQQLISALIASFPSGDESERIVTKSMLAENIAAEQQSVINKAMAALPESMIQFHLPLRCGDSAFGSIMMLFGDEDRVTRESIGLYRRVADLAALRLETILAPSVTKAAAEIKPANPGTVEASQPASVIVPSNGTAVSDFMVWHRIESNVDTTRLGVETPETIRAIESLVEHLFGRSSDSGLYLSAYEDNQYRYFQVTTSEPEMQRFRNKLLDVVQWQSSLLALDFPESFRNLNGEYSVSNPQGRLESIVWRVPRDVRKKEKQRRLSILGIDDQEVIRELLSNIITRMGHKITTVESGQEALRLFRQEQFDLVIAEAGMPDISGWSISEQVKKHAPQTPVIILSGWDNIADLEKAHAGHADFVLTKPFKMEQLGKVIGAACQMITA